MILFLYGEDTYRSRARLRKLRKAFCEKHDPSGVNSIRVDGEKMTADAFITHLTVQGFLTPKRFIVVENFCTQGKPKEQQAVLDHLRPSKFFTDNIVVFWEEGELPSVKGKKHDPGVQLWQAVAEQARMEHFAPLAAAGMTKWYTQEIASRGGAIEKIALQHLIHLVGDNLWQASSEIDKLIAFKGGQPITETDVDQMVLAPIDENIFALTDALGQRNMGTALRLLENQFQQGAAPLYLLRMFAWHVRNLIGVRSMLDEGVNNPKTIARELRLHPFVAQKTMRQAAAFTLDDLRRVYGELLEIDSTLKSRSVDPRVLLTMLVMPLAAGTSVSASSRV